ncbi:MAG: shikimate kinase [Bacteroidales bacterium]
MKLFAVTGNPIAHSKSPELFALAYGTAQEQFAYFRLAADSASEAFGICKDLGIRGINITAPFKSDFVSLSTHLSPEVQTLSCCNTLLFEGDEVKAYNTDIEGVLGALRQAEVPLDGLSCLVLGAGSAGRTAAYALHSVGAKVTIVNRTLEKAQSAAQSIACLHISAQEIEGYLPQVELIVNTISGEQSLLPTQSLSPQHTLFDAVYHQSSFRDISKQQGCRYIAGNYWLLHQAIPSFRRFTGVAPDVEAMRAIFTERKSSPRHIALIGFMGTGKSTIAPLLAQMLGLPTVDTDVEIEQRCAMTVPEIIAQRGITYFRQQEQAVVHELLARSESHVISCGGGVITQSALAQRLKSSATVVWLYASPSVCLERINVATRPLLAQQSEPLQAAQQLFAERKFAYAHTAHLLINASVNNPQVISQKIYDQIHTLHQH